MWNLLRRTRKNQKSGRDVREAGWTSLFQAVAEPFPGAWLQGVKADPEAVLSFHAVFACISLISQDIAKMRLRLMQTDAHGIRRETRRGDIARLCRRPNTQQNRIQFFELWLNAKLRHGNTVVLKIRNARGQIKELRILDWSRVEPLVADDGEVFYRITPDRNCGITEAVTVPAREVIHDRFNCFFHPLIGLPPVYAAGLAATQGHHIQENSTSFFRNGGRPSGVIEIPGSITEENAKKLKSNWDSGYTGENAGKTAILSNGAKYNPTTFSPVDAQTVEQLKMTAEIVCSVFRVPAYKIGVGQPPSSDNVEALETGENESTEFDVTTLLRMDSERRMKTLGDAVKNTLLTPNEARKRENLPPLAGGDALYLQQQNYSLEALSRRDAREDPFSSAGKTVSSQLPDGASDGNKAISETEHDAVKAMFRGDTEKMTERELSIIRALGEEFSTVLADLQRTFEGKMASQAQAFEEKLTSLSAVLQKHVTVDEVRPVLQAMVDDAVGAIPVPRDGRDYDPDVLQQAVNDAVANIPQPADGKSLTPDDVRPMLEQMVKEAVSHIPVPRDGRDYDPDVLQKAVNDAVSALPAPQDGRDATALEILPAIDDQKSFPRGTYATHQGGLWRAYEKTHGMRGWECLVDGVADIDVSMTGERLFSVVVRQSSGQRTEKTFSLPVMLYRGVFRAGETYHPGDTVTWGGSLWHCNSMTEDKPGEAHSSAWTLAAKRGRDAGGGK
ncbi:phage portal protein [Escherichia coli]|uniref:phage portal protein n=1 Tax=Escherichia coli TaxID=562 RepID=UPI000DF27B89|nr:phage portal protein [Escherichia coli]RCP88391.1 phage portal protein [Escherichia coli]